SAQQIEIVTVKIDVRDLIREVRNRSPLRRPRDNVRDWCCERSHLLAYVREQQDGGLGCRRREDRRDLNSFEGDLGIGAAGHDNAIACRVRPEAMKASA